MHNLHNSDVFLGFFLMFLKDYDKKLYHHLMKLFETNKCAICLFPDREYHYRGRDWSLKETWDVSLSEQMQYEEKLKENRQKRIELFGPIPPEKKKKISLF